MKFLAALSWETLQNLPMILGFLVAARLRPSNFWLALACLLVGILAGLVIMHFTEAKLHPTPIESNLKGALVNLLVFVVLALPFLFYFSSESAWINWKSDLILGVAVGVLMAAGQSTAWKGPKARMVLHGAAMAAACPLIMIGLRLLLSLSSWVVMLLDAALLTLLASLVIVLIDYRSVYVTGPKFETDNPRINR